jgi:lysophospholipase L1-like esterase
MWYRNSTLVVQSILPTALEWIGNDAIRNANRALREIAHEYEAEYLDVYGTFVDSRGNPRTGYLSDDGVHLAGRGYEAWADEIERFLKNL